MRQKVIVTFGAAFAIALTLACVGGWAANIIKLAGMNFADPVTGELILRLVGVVLAPIGVVMGYI